MSIHKHFVSNSILLLEIIFYFAVLFMHLNFLHIFCNQFLLVLMDPFLMAFYETLVRLCRLLVFFSIEPRHILMSFCVRVRLLIELGLSRLERLLILKFLAVEVKILTH